MRAVVWIVETTWEACVDEARAFLPADAEITLLHVAPGDVEDLAAGGRAALLGRRPPPPSGPPLRAIAAGEAEALLAEAQSRLGRPAQLLARRGRAEQEVVEACDGADLLVLGAGGDPDSVIRRASLPLLLARWCPAGTRVTDRILIAIDDESEPDRAAEAAGLLASRYGGAVAVVSAAGTTRRTCTPSSGRTTSR